MTDKRILKNGYTFTLFKGDADVLCTVLTENEEAEKIFAALPHPRPNLIAVTGYDWYGDLSPWQAKRAFKGSSDFSGGADGFLTRLTKDLSEAEKEFGLSPNARFIAGYSLAGLFAVYSLFRTDIFDGAVSASGSMWFDGFTDFMKDAPLTGNIKAVYLSVGDREKITRNQRLAAVEDETVKAVGIFREKGVDAVFELNTGNHFTEPEKRLAKGILTLAEKLA